MSWIRNPFTGAYGPGPGWLAQPILSITIYLFWAAGGWGGEIGSLEVEQTPLFLRDREEGGPSVTYGWRGPPDRRGGEVLAVSLKEHWILCLALGSVSQWQC